MTLLIVLVRIALTVVFGLAGVTKLIDQRGTREAVKNFGAPKWLAPALSIVLPFTELAIALGLLFVSTTPASSLAAIIVLTVFVIAISVNLARGRTHDCHCFGQIYSRPLGWPTLVRNLVFAAGAVFVFWQAKAQGTPSILTTLFELSFAGWLGLAIVLAGVTAAAFYVARRQKKAAASPAVVQQGLPINSEAPAFEVAAYRGGTISLVELLSDKKPVLLIFTNPKCGPCVALFEEIKLWQESHREQLTIALLSMGTIKENFVNVARNGLGEVLLQKNREVAEQYGAKLTPTAVVVDTEGRIASQLAAGADQIRKLLTTVVGNSHGSPNHNHGDTA